MENLSGSISKKSQLDVNRRKNRRSKSWTLLIVGDLGQIRSFRIGKSMLVALTVSLSVTAILAAVSIFSFSSLTATNLSLRQELKRSMARSDELATDKNDVSARLKVPNAKAKDPIKREQRPQESDKTYAGRQHSNDEKTAPYSTVSASESEEKKEKASVSEDGEARNEVETADDVLAPLVSVDTLEIWPAANRQAINYRLVLKRPKPGPPPFSGYVFVVLEPEPGFSEPARASPWTPLDEGSPTQFKRGRFFSVVRQIEIHEAFPGIYAVNRFRTATVYIYSTEGTLLVERIYDITSIQRA